MPRKKRTKKTTPKVNPITKKINDALKHGKAVIIKHSKKGLRIVPNEKVEVIYRGDEE